MEKQSIVSLNEAGLMSTSSFIEGSLDRSAVLSLGLIEDTRIEENHGMCLSNHLVLGSPDVSFSLLDAEQNKKNSEAPIPEISSVKETTVINSSLSVIDSSMGAKESREENATPPLAVSALATLKPSEDDSSTNEEAGMAAISSDSSTSGSTKLEQTVKPEPKRVPRRSTSLPSAKCVGTMGSSLFPRNCLTHAPTIEELKHYTFSDYIREVVLGAALPKFEDYDDCSNIYDNEWSRKTMPLTEGIAKVTLPVGFWEEEGIGKDRTGRGPAWQKGQPLGDLMLQSPIAQHIRGMAGVYEYTFTDNSPISVAEFRELADNYRESQIGAPFDENQQDACEERTIQLDRQFWKRLGPTMPAARYGADQEGSLFGNDPASGWNVGELDSCLHVLNRVPGVTTPYLYAGMWASVFCAHTEDMNLLSINYLHAGAPKIWYAIAPGPDSKRFEALCEFHYSDAARSCKEFMRHKRYLLSPMVLHKAGIKYKTCIQRPGDAVVTFPGGYHFGFNSGFNMAEATNFGVPEWIPYGLKANVCLCRPDSVRIDMNKLIALLDIFETDRGRKRNFSWKAWSRKREETKHKKRGTKPTLLQSRQHLAGAEHLVGPKSKRSKKKLLSEQERKNEFWIEVVKPAPKPPLPKVKKQERSVEEGRGMRKRKKTERAAQWEAENKMEARPLVIHKEIWRLAKPIGRKGVHPNARILCLLPGTVLRSINEVDSNESGEWEEDEDEQCFAGQVVEVTDNHIRVRIDGLPKSDDVWLPLGQSKVFLDGGQWGEEENFEMPKLHYWREMDSKRRCVGS